MIPKTFDEAFSEVKTLAQRFADNEAAYLSPKYQEAEVRQDFLDRFFIALGWDVYHHEHPNPYEREVRIERSVMVGDRGKKADYAFFTRPNFLQARFMAEAKKPSRQLENPYDCFQAMRYGWNSNTPLAVLTDFEQFLVLDSRYKPTVERAINGILERFHYSQFADEESFRKIYYLFSRESVGDGSLEKFVQGLKKTKTAKAAKAGPATQIQPVGDTFLAELDTHRENLARSFKRRNPQLDGDELTEITQRTLDRLVFIRFLEDKLVEPSEIIDRLGQKSGSTWRDFAAEIPRLNQIYNGIIFKPHAILDAPDFQPDDKTFGETLHWLSHKNSPYDFNSIPIHILGSIYERFLGKTIVTTDKRATVEEKPEVRKAGGVYYTPEYIVRYIVENTIGKLVEGKTPDEIAKMRFADIACGSGSFLLGIFDYLIKYHVDWYSGVGTQAARLHERETRTTREQTSAPNIREQTTPKRVASGPLAVRRSNAIKQNLVRETAGGTLQLTLEHKRDILLNNLYGVDLDAQAVEVAQLSLYLKLLEEETTATVQPKLGGLREQLLPNLNKNIVHGNSLIDFDIMDGLGFDAYEHKKLYPMNFESTFPEVFAGGGFDAIVGNPPYVRIQTMQETSPVSVEHFKKRYVSAGKGSYDIYVVFVEKALSLLNDDGKVGYILPHKFFNAQYGEALRGLVSKGKHLCQVVHFGDQQVFGGATTYTCLFHLNKKETAEFEYIKANDLAAWREKDIGASGRISADKVTAQEWNFAVGEGALLFERLRGMPIKLGEIANIFVGVQTSADDVFILDYISQTDSLLRLRSKSLGADIEVERDLFKPIVSGIDVKHYSLLGERQFILFPYRVSNETAELISTEEISRVLPKTYDYLLENRKRLEDRERGKFRDSSWHRFGRNQNLGIQGRPKICVPRLVDKLQGTIDSDGSHFLDNVDVGGVTLKHDPAFVSHNLNFLLGLITQGCWYGISRTSALHSAAAFVQQIDSS